MVDSTDLKDSVLEADGWERRSIMDGPLLEDAVKLYEDLGFEVLVKDVGVDDLDPNICVDCFACKLKIVYTRAKRR